MQSALSSRREQTLHMEGLLRGYVPPAVVGIVADFLTSLLQHEPTRRKTLLEAAEHDWLTCC